MEAKTAKADKGRQKEQPESESIVVKLRCPHPFQRPVLYTGAKRIIVCAGRRSGKTVVAATRAVDRMMKGKRVLYCAPTTDQVERFWVECKRALNPLVAAGIVKKNETEHTLEFPGTERRIRAKAAWNADTLRGDYADELIMDEYQLMNEDAWEIVGAPMLLDNNGNALFIYTPPSLRSRSVTKANDPQHASKLFKRAKADTSGRWLAVHFTSHDNPFISREALADITQDMTALAIRQEIMAEDIDSAPGALWTRTGIEANRVTEAPPLVRIVVAVDPPADSRAAESGCGIAVGGIDARGQGYLLLDGTCEHVKPVEWGSRAIQLYEQFQADRIVGETNNGGEMVEYVLRSIQADVAYKEVRASRGKAVRAEPIAAYSEQGRIHFVGEFPKLEDELCLWTPGDASPHRLDAFVWLFTELMLGTGALPIDDKTKELLKGANLYA